MAGGSRPFAAGFAVGALVALGCAWLLWGRAGTGASTPGQAGCATCGADAATPQPSAVAAPTPAVPAAAESVAGSAPETPAAAVATPRDAFDSPAWRRARLAFRPRELGSMGPYVQAGLDAARRDMGFCFRQGGAAAERTLASAAGPQGQGEPASSPRPDPAILLLYVEAREGALDVIDTRLEYRGTLSPEVVECCREVLRGLEIKAFNTVPGKRYRVKFRLR
jgi:hypothetical protein